MPFLFLFFVNKPETIGYYFLGIILLFIISFMGNMGAGYIDNSFSIAIYAVFSSVLLAIPFTVVLPFYLTYYYLLSDGSEVKFRGPIWLF